MNISILIILMIVGFAVGAIIGSKHWPAIEKNIENKLNGLEKGVADAPFHSNAMIIGLVLLGMAVLTWYAKFIYSPPIFMATGVLSFTIGLSSWFVKSRNK